MAAALTEAFVHLWRPGDGWRPIGVVVWRERGRLSTSAFRYARSWLADPDAFAIDPRQLPLTPASQTPPEGFGLPNGPER